VSDPKLLESLRMVMRGGRVTSFHTKPVLKEENVAEHSYVVAWLATLYYDHRPSAELLLSCLAHDMPEYVLGDVPSPTKKKVPGLKEMFDVEERGLFAAHHMPVYEDSLSPHEKEVLKFCDNLAGYLKCLFETSMGNRHLANTAQRYYEYIVLTVNSSEHMDKDRARLLLATSQKHNELGQTS